ECRGLPIVLLHQVFAQYLSLSKQALPATREARIALQVARELCDTMRDHFKDENARRDKFVRVIQPLFSLWMPLHEVTAEGNTASMRTDATISAKVAKGVNMVLTEIKNGKNSGDPYMEASRRYEINTEALTEEHSDFLNCGAPTFICCLIGSSTMILNRR
ncbi:3405_t:CDS:1, partial [Acaulospora colombiana]